MNSILKISNSSKIESFISKIQSRILEIRSWPEYIPQDDELIEKGIPSFEDWYNGRKDDFESGITIELAFDYYNRLKYLATSNNGWFK